MYSQNTNTIIISQCVFAPRSINQSIIVFKVRIGTGILITWVTPEGWWMFIVDPISSCTNKNEVDIIYEGKKQFNRNIQKKMLLLQVYNAIQKKGESTTNKKFEYT